MTTWTRQLLIVEDEPLVATLLSDLLAQQGFDVRKATSAAQARSIIRDEFDPDCALIDIHLGDGPTGLHLGHILHKVHPHIGLIFLTRFPESHLAAEEGMEIPAGSALLAKDRVTDSRHLMDVIEGVLRGTVDDSPAIDGSPSPLSQLTRTQLQILRLAASGLTNQAIAEYRNTSERTVEQRLQAVYIALQIPLNSKVNPRVEAIRQYIAHLGLPDPPASVTPS